MRRPSRSIADFARNTLGKSLYPYQCEVAEAVLDSIYGEHGRIFSVMMSRQSGKNQLSAVLEAYLLSTMSEGTIVKAAPTFRPQITNSRLRLLSLLDNAETGERIWQSQGNIVGLAPANSVLGRRNRAGPRVMFFSAAPVSNVVGATADLLLEIDEAQDVEHEKFERDFRPMCATTNATTILYGTAWSDATLLAQQRAVNLELAARTGLRQHFEYDWTTLAAFNPAYRRYVEQEIARLGVDNSSIQTQYFLHPINGADYLLDTRRRMLLQGTHAWQEQPREDEFYIAGMDVAGEERPVPGKPLAVAGQRDSTVITIGRIRYNEMGIPMIEVVHQEWWTGMQYMQQYQATVALVEHWRIRRLVVDATGLGAVLASLLQDRLGQGRVTPFIFTRPSKSKLAFQLTAYIDSGRLKLFAAEAAPLRIFTECWQQLRRARYRIPAPEMLDMYVERTEGHDDFLISLALLTAGSGVLTTPATSTLIQPARLYADGDF